MATDSGTAGGKTKGKKNKGTKLDINDIVDPNSFKMVDSWADEMENEEIRAPMVNLPTGPKTTTGLDVDIDAVPQVPPFKANVSNISFDSNITHLEKFFAEFNSPKITMGGEPGRSSGNAVVEFNSRNDLIEALHMNGKTLGNRQLKIYLPSSDRGYGSGGGRRPYHDNTPSNWRSREGLPPKNQFAPPPTAPEFEGRSGGAGGGSNYGGGAGGGFRNNYGGNGGYNRDNDGGFGRRGDSGGFMRRDRYGDDGNNWQARGPPKDSADGGNTDSNWRSAPRPALPEPREPRNDHRNEYRSNDRNDRFGGDRDGGSFRNDRRDDYQNRQGYDRRDNHMNRNNYQNDRNYQDRPAPNHYDRQNSADRPVSDGPAAANAPAAAPPAPPKEKIAMKEVFQAIIQVEEDSKPTSYNSIFGGAKPVDTIQKELEIERKLAEERKKKEAEVEALKKEAEANASASEKGNISDNASVNSEQQAQPQAQQHQPPKDRQAYNRDNHNRDLPPRQRRENGRDDNNRYQRRYEGDRNGGTGGPRRYDGDRNGSGGYRPRNDMGPPRDSGMRKDGYVDRNNRNYNNRGRDGPNRYNNPRGHDNGMQRRHDYHVNDDEMFEKKSNTNYATSNKFSHLEDAE